LLAELSTGFICQLSINKPLATKDSQLSKSIRALLVEHSDDDAQLLVQEMRQGGYNIDLLRVETPAGLSNALSEKTWDIVLAEYKMPNFNGTDALRLFKRAGLDCPFVIVSGAIVRRDRRGDYESRCS